MKATSERIHLDSRWFSPERDVARSKGLHLSHILNYIEQQEGRGYLAPDDPPDKDIDEIGHAFAAGGFLWEEVIHRLTEGDQTQLWEWLFTGVMNNIDDPDVFRPGEQCVDGIFLTPDGVKRSNGRLKEYKYTTKSSNTPVTSSDKFGRWTEMQIPAYLYALQLTECELDVYHAKGDYRSYEPVWMHHVLLYTEQELEDIWEWIVRNGEAMKKEGLV